MFIIELYQFGLVSLATLFLLVTIVLWNKLRDARQELLEQKTMHTEYVIKVAADIDNQFNSLSDKNNKLIQLGNELSTLKERVEELTNAKATSQT